MSWMDWASLVFYTYQSPAGDRGLGSAIVLALATIAATALYSYSPVMGMF